MKWRYLKITTGDMIWGTNNLTRDDLIRCKNGGYEAILDLQNGTYYDADANEWKEITGDES